MPRERKRKQNTHRVSSLQHLRTPLHFSLRYFPLYKDNAFVSVLQVAHKEREVEELRRMLERTTVQHPDVGATRSQLIHQLRAKDDQIKVR